MRVYCSVCHVELPSTTRCPDCLSQEGDAPLCFSFEFLVQGSQPEPYLTDFAVVGNRVTAHCTCPAGAFGGICKHRISILVGDIANVVSDNLSDLSALVALVPSSTAASPLAELFAAEKFVAEAQNRLKRAKRELGHALIG
jgi:hypothetical protein